MIARLGIARWRAGSTIVRRCQNDQDGGEDLLVIAFGRQGWGTVETKWGKRRGPALIAHNESITLGDGQVTHRCIHRCPPRRVNRVALECPTHRREAAREVGCSVKMRRI